MTLSSSPSASAPLTTAAPSPARRLDLYPERTTRATGRQLTGLVRIVASIGGAGETLTGMVLRPNGLVVTNNHGVAGATAVQATVMRSGRTFRARVVATAPGRDVALLRLQGASGLATVGLARRDGAVGARSTVVGDARGRRAYFTAATGTLIARKQTLVTPRTSTAPAERLTGLLLTTCNVVTGVSGGPTYGGSGRVIGMTTAAVRSGGKTYGVAIPARALRAVVSRLLS